MLQLWSLLFGRLVCLDVKDSFCSALLIYNFRIFERRFGSRKFAVSTEKRQPIYTFPNLILPKLDELNLKLCRFVTFMKEKKNQ